MNVKVRPSEFQQKRARRKLSSHFQVTLADLLPLLFL